MCSFRLNFIYARFIIKSKHRRRSDVSIASGIYEEVGPALPSRPTNLAPKHQLEQSEYIDGKRRYFEQAYIVVKTNFDWKQVSIMP